LSRVSDALQIKRQLPTWWAGQKPTPVFTSAPSKYRSSTGQI